MLKDTLIHYLADKGNGNIHLFKEEKEFVEKYELLSADYTIVEETGENRFSDAYIERVHKETEELVTEEVAKTILEQPIRFLNEHKDEFLYLEDQSFEAIGVDGLTFEEDDVFKTYNVLLGLKQPKKRGNQIKAFLTEELNEESTAFQLMFNDKDGLWDLNFTLNLVDRFDENISFSYAYELIYRFLFRLVCSVEENK